MGMIGDVMALRLYRISKCILCHAAFAYSIIMLITLRLKSVDIE